MKIITDTDIAERKFLEKGFSFVYQEKSTSVYLNEQTNNLYAIIDYRLCGENDLKVLLDTIDVDHRIDLTVLNKEGKAFYKNVDINGFYDLIQWSKPKKVRRKTKKTNYLKNIKVHASV